MNDGIDMLFNYLKVFARTSIRHPGFTLVNVLGLAVALACCLIIGLYVQHELSVDRHHANADNLYRISLESVDPAGVKTEGAPIFFPVAPLLADNFPEIDAVARMRPWSFLMSAGEVRYFEYGLKLVDPEFFRIFDMTWLQGTPASALAEPRGLVITRSAAQKYFGDSDPMGRELDMPDGVTLRVSGVIEDLPSNTHMTGSMFASMALRDILEPVEERTAEWFNGSYYTYVLLRPDVDVAGFRRDLADFSAENIPAAFNTSFTLIPDAVTDIHLNRKIGDMAPSGSKRDIAVFVSIGAAILFIACVNFVNLTTARASQRIGEVGVRLALGARRRQLLVQFLGESVLCLLGALLLAFVLVEFLLPVLAGMLGLELQRSTMSQPKSLATVIGIGLVLGLAAGWYPALVVSGLRPLAALGKTYAAHTRGLALKNTLVMVQFAIAIVLISAAFIIQAQMRFAGDFDTGFNQQRVVVIRGNEVGSLERFPLLKQQLAGTGVVAAATLSESTPQRYDRYTFVTAQGDESSRRFAYMSTDFDYFSVYGVNLLAGRLLQEDMPTDLVTDSNDSGEVNGSFVLNERGAREFGWSPSEAIGKLIQRNGRWYRVVGVVGNSVESVYAEVMPAIYAVPQGLAPGRLLSLRLADTDTSSSLALIDSIWERINPDEPIVRSFLDDNIAAQYQGEQRQMYLVFLFAGLSIAICCMGLYALAAFNAQLRTTEIGVRKVMGSSVWRIVLLLTNDFSKLVLIANVIAWPLAWVAMNRWLEQFAYRIDLTPMIFIGSGLIALCVAWVTVGGTAAKAASLKPVLALRYE